MKQHMDWVIVAIFCVLCVMGGLVFGGYFTQKYYKSQPYDPQQSTPQHGDLIDWNDDFNEFGQEVAILTDRETGQQYIAIHWGYGSAITPRLGVNKND